MPDFPGALAPTCRDEFYNYEWFASELIAQGLLTSQASITWPAANRAMYFPFVVGAPFLVAKVAWENAATVNGNTDMGIYDAAFNKIVSAGSTAQAGANAAQVVDITDTTLLPGRYWMALASSSGTATYFGWSFSAAGLAGACGILQQASAMALPASATPAAMASTVIPLIHVKGRVL